MKTKSTRWVRLLTAIIVAISLGLFISPAAVALPCNPTPPDSCLQVNIISPEDGYQVGVNSYFWVNASVAKPPAPNTCHSVMVEMNVIGITGTAEKVAPIINPPLFDLTTCEPVKDFWWLVKCTGAGDVKIEVSASSPDCCASLITDQIIVEQVLPPCETKMEVEIIECPSGPVDVSDVFGVKAYVKNLTDKAITNVTANITLVGLECPEKSGCEPGTAELVGCPPSFSLGCIPAGCEEEVGWTLHCTSPGCLTAVVDVQEASYTIPDFFFPDGNCGRPDGMVARCEIKSDDCLIQQLMPSKISLEISGVPEKICTNCGENCFTVAATISELCGDTGVYGGCATISKVGNVVITGPLTKDVPDIPAGGSQTVTWDVCCSGVDAYGVPTTITVDFHGYDMGNYPAPDQPRTDSKTVSVYQTDLKINIVSPADGTLYNVCNEYDVVMEAKNCTNSNIVDVFVQLDLSQALNVNLDSPNVALTFGDPACAVPNPPVLTAVETDPGSRIYQVVIPCLCPCCLATLTWDVSCAGTAMLDCDVAKAMETIGANIGKMPSDLRDDDSIEVGQMWKAHLEGGLLVVEGTMSDNDFQGDFPIQAIPVGDDFTVVMPIANLGQAAAENVHVVLGVVGNVETQYPLDQDIPEIPCHGAAKLFWEFTCMGGGPVTFTVTELSGTDQNTGEAIPLDNINVPCPLTIQQIPIPVRIIQPLTCTDITVGQTFTVKAEVCNDSGLVLEGVTAVLNWIAEDCEDNQNCPPPGGMKLAVGQKNPIPLNDLTPQECAEATWQMVCCAPTDVEFWVEIFVSSPVMSAESGSELIHQQMPGALCAKIISPQLQRTDLFGYCHLIGPYIATSQDFTVTAELKNWGGFPITVTDAYLENITMGPPWIPAGTFSSSEANPALPYVLNPGDSKIVSFNLHCDSAGFTMIALKVEGEDTLCLKHYGGDMIMVQQYAAAHLEVNVTDYPADPIAVGSNFTVTATITNTGEADAWEAAAVLSVFPEGSVRVTTGGYTQPLGNLIGHGEDGSQTITWNLACKAECNSTITISATGYDEYGYHTKQLWSDVCYHSYGPGGGDGWVLYLEPEAGLPIQSRFIEPMSVTVKQGSGDGGDGGEGEQTTTTDIALETGWNLMSSPYYILPASDAPATVLAGIWDNLNSVWAYDACAAEGERWSNTATSGPPGSLTHVRDGRGYWVQMNAPDTLSITGDVNPPPPEMPPTYQVCTGWNLIGFKQDAPKTASLYLQGVSFGVIYGFDNGQYFAVQAGQNLIPGNGYWVAVFSPGTIYP